MRVRFARGLGISLMFAGAAVVLVSLGFAVAGTPEIGIGILGGLGLIAFGWLYLGRLPYLVLTGALTALWASVPRSGGVRAPGHGGGALVPRVYAPDMTGRVFLLRHGETEWSLSGKHTGRTDVPLTERGRELAAAAGRLATGLRAEPPALVLTSPRSRARDTARLAGFRVDEVDERLAEWDYGEYEGRTTAEIRETVPGWTVWTHRCPGGETAGEVGRRADGVIARTAEALDRGDVVLVGHGHFSRVLVARWIGLAAAEGVRFAMEAPSWAVLGHERGVPRLDHVNLTPKGRS